MNIFKIPKLTSRDFQEQAKFAFIWRITSMFSCAIIVLTVIAFITDPRFLYFYVAVFILIVLALILLYRLPNYKPIVIGLFLGMSLIIAGSVFLVPEAYYFQESLWMVVLILAAFFTLGNKWGVFYLGVNLLIYFIYYNFFFENSEALQGTVSKLFVFSMIIEFAVSMFLIGYIMFQFSIVNNYAINQSIKAYEELKEEKQIVEKQNKEKTVLLQEIHHRVKNNFQVIVSLLRIQTNELKSQEAKDSFQDAIARILTMSLIHQKMYEKESLVDIDVKDYLNTLIKDLIHANITEQTIEYNIDVKMNSISAKRIVPLGLIINELVSNSLKHAFQQKGKLTISLEATENDTFSVVYRDNGKWKKSREDSLGIQLIDVFTEQLEGQVQREINGEGTHYYFTQLHGEE